MELQVRIFKNYHIGNQTSASLIGGSFFIEKNYFAKSIMRQMRRFLSHCDIMVYKKCWELAIKSITVNIYLFSFFKKGKALSLAIRKLLFF